MLIAVIRKIFNELVIVVERKLSNFSANRGENKLFFSEMMMRSTKLDFYSASSLKQQSADRHVAPLGHIIIFALFT